MTRICGIVIVALTLSGVVLPTEAHPAESPIGDWTFVPRYVLPGNGAQTLGPRPSPPEPVRTPIAYEPTPVSLYGLASTERLPRLLERSELPEGPFTAELWVIDHVNQPVGILMAAKGYGPGDDVAWAVGMVDERAIMQVGGRGAGTTIDAPTKALAYEKYWRHIVGVFDGVEARLYVNGVPVATGEVSAGYAYDEHAQLEIAAYLEHEPYMDLGNILHSARVYGGAMSEDHIKERFETLSGAVADGVLFPGRMHFTAGPYLNMTTQRSTALVWETDRPTKATVYFGDKTPLDQSITIEGFERINEAVIDGLEPATMYYYRVLAEDEAGRGIDSGLLTFQTAVAEDSPYVFAVIGDTEARPHINDRIAKLVWEQRPNFVVNCGDLTDGGKEPYKFQWTHEYFLGMGQLHSRVPCFPVAGNGEGDLYWYKKYHALPDPEGYYSFRYGNAEFFMLDSNRSASEFGPGGEQYEWLNERLASSTATWKFAAHHHPTVTSDENDYGNTWVGEASPQGDTNVMPIMALYEKYRVDAVFFGHLHSYERSWPILEGKVNADEGVVYIQTGGGGGNPEDFRPAKTWFNHNSFHGHHYCVIAINGGVLEFRMFNTDGSLRDVTRIEKPDQNSRLSGTAGE